MLNMVILNKNNWEEKLHELLSIDCDWSGDNGIEYTSGEAIEEGYESDLDYAIARAKEKSDDVINLVQYVLEDFVTDQQEIGYYIEVEYMVKGIGDDLAVSVVAVCQE